VAAAFHDLGLIKKFSSPDERFEAMAQMPPDSFLAPITLLKIRCRPFGKPLPFTPPPASRSKWVPK
jgi:hypothetical protein